MNYMQPVDCHSCGKIIGVLPLGWEVPKFIICNSCRLKELEDEE